MAYKILFQNKESYHDWDKFLHFFSQFTICIYERIEVCLWILNTEALLLIRPKNFWAKFMGSFKYRIMLSPNRHNLTSSFSIFIIY